MADNTHSIDLELSSSQYGYVADSASLSITGDISFEAFVKIEQLPSTAGSSMVILNKGHDTDNKESFVFYLTSGDDLRIIISEDGTSSDRTIVTTDAVVVNSDSVGKWIHFAGTVDVSGPTVKLYKNGFLVESTASSSNAVAIHDGNGTIAIGARRKDDASAELYMDGKVAKVRIWDDIRTQTEIRNNMFKDVTGDANLQAYWKLSNNWVDAENSNNMTAVGSPTFSADVPFPRYDDLTNQVEFDSLTTKPGNVQAYYKLEDTSDEEGGSNLTNNNSVAFNSGKFNDGADGGASNSNKYLSIADAKGYTGGAYSVSFWLKMNTEIAASAYTIPFEVADAGTDTSLLVEYTESSGRKLNFMRLRRGVAADFFSYYVDLGTTYAHHIVLTYNGSTVKGYINGILVGSAASSGNGTTALTDLLHILAGRNPSAYISAIVDDFIVFDDELTAEEVFNIYVGKEIVTVEGIPGKKSLLGVGQ